MNNSELLKQKIEESGKTVTFLAKKVGLSRTGFYNCIANKAEFKSSQIKILCDELNIKSLKEIQRIFFADIGA